MIFQDNNNPKFPEFRTLRQVRCVHTEVNITFGKIYKVLYVDNDKVWIMNDKNIQNWYFAKWFVGIQEERKIKLNKIKNKGNV